tara:strand:+ start:421 stop:744 length:324 start_codon:yes stop_codon:yes gene_type:complete
MKATRKRTRKKVTDGTVSKSTKVNKQLQKDETQPANRPVTTDGEPAFVSLGQKVTIMPEQFQPIQVSINITIPCEPTPEAIDKAKDWLSEKVDEYLKEEITRSTAGI